MFVTNTLGFGRHRCKYLWGIVCAFLCASFCSQRTRDVIITSHYYVKTTSRRRFGVGYNDGNITACICPLGWCIPLRVFSQLYPIRSMWKKIVGLGSRWLVISYPIVLPSFDHLMVVSGTTGLRPIGLSPGS